MMDILRRGSAQLSEAVWKELDEAAATAARNVMTARRIATFDGPRGWDYIATPLGTMKACATREGKAVVCMPEVALLAQIRADFSLPWSAVEAFERGGPALDTATAEDAAREVGLAEDRLAYSGDPVGTGFLEDPSSPRVQLGDWTDPVRVIGDLVQAVEMLDRLTIPGPYEAVLSPGRYYAYLAAANRGYPVPRHTKNIVAEVHRSLVMRDGGALFSLRGGDFILTVGGDLAVGYRSHDRDALHLFCVETLAPQTLSPDAVCRLEGESPRA
jgi:uncharacterized linocin/CFP29 family protein